MLAQVIEKLLKTNWRSNSRDATSLFLFSVFWTHHNHLFLLVQMAAVREHNNGVEEEEYTLLEYSPGKQRETACQMFIESCYLRYDDIAEVLFSCTLKLLFSGDVHAKQHSWNFNALPSSIQKINSEKTSRTTAQITLRRRSLSYNLMFCPPLVFRRPSSQITKDNKTFWIQVLSRTKNFGDLGHLNPQHSWQGGPTTQPMNAFDRSKRIH